MYAQSWQVMRVNLAEAEMPHDIAADFIDAMFERPARLEDVSPEHILAFFAFAARDVPVARGLPAERVQLIALALVSEHLARARLQTTLKSLFSKSSPSTLGHARELQDLRLQALCVCLPKIWRFPPRDQLGSPEKPQAASEE
jgi:hypothetical protein